MDDESYRIEWGQPSERIRIVSEYYQLDELAITDTCGGFFKSEIANADPQVRKKDEWQFRLGECIGIRVVGTVTAD